MTTVDSECVGAWAFEEYGRGHFFIDLTQVPPERGNRRFT